MPKLDSGLRVANTCFENLLERGDLKGAEQLSLQIVNQFPDDPLAWCRHATLLRLLARPAEALSIIQRSLKLEETPEALSELIETCYAMGNIDNAKEVATRLIQRFPSWEEQVQKVWYLQDSQKDLDYPALLDSKVKRIQVVGIVYDGRSGTVFLQSLLDSHSQVLMFPATVLLVRNYFDFWECHGKEDLATLIEEFGKQFHTAFDSREDLTWCRLNQLGENQNEHITVDLNQFKYHLRRFLGDKKYNRRIFFIAIHLAYALTRGEDLDQKKVLVHALHVPDEPNIIQPFLEDHPKAKIILVTRYPRASYSSLLRHFMRRIHYSEGASYNEFNSNWIWPRNIYKHILTSHKVLVHHVSSNRIRAIRLEDIHVHSTKTLKRLARWLGIQFESSLLESTFCGKAWWGDVTIPPVHGFSNHIKTDRWKQDFHWLDSFWLEFLLQNRLKNYGYDLSRNYDSLWHRIVALFAILIPTKIELKIARNYFRIQSHKHKIRLSALALICSNFGYQNGALNIDTIRIRRLFAISMKHILSEYWQFHKNFFRFLAGIYQRWTLCFELYRERIMGKDVTFKRL